MTSGLRKGLTSYGDAGFSLFLRKAFIKAMGYSDDALERPIVGITNTYSDYNPCHGNVPDIIEAAKRGVMLSGAMPFAFPTISIHESFSHPTSMYLRNLMAMDTEEMIRAQPMDAVIVIGGCDKTLPAQIMAALSADLPTVVIPVGPMVVGHHKGEVLGACTDCRRLWAKYRAGEIDDSEIEAVGGRLAPSVGTCMVMGTASTMACVTEALGLSLPMSATIPAPHAERLGDRRHRARRPHDGAGAGGRREVAFDLADLVALYLAGAVARPEAPAIGAGAEPLAMPARGQHRPGNEADGRPIGRNRPHELGGHRLVAAADEDNRIHRLGADHLLGVHSHEVTKHQACRAEKHLAERDCRKGQRQAAHREHAAFDGVDQLGKVPVAVVEAGICVGDADHWPRQKIDRIPHRARKGAPQIKSEIGVAVIGKAAGEANRLGHAVLSMLSERSLLPTVRDVQERRLRSVSAVELPARQPREHRRTRQPPKSPPRLASCKRTRLSRLR